MLVSIITPSYNSSKYIAEAINSVRVQTYNNWEMLIVDDCSKDNSVEIIQSFIKKDNRNKLIKLKSNVGSAEARNIALRQAKGKYIAFLDSDDLWLPDKLEKQLNFMIKNGYAFTFTAYQPFSKKNKIYPPVKVPESITYKGYLKNTIIGCLTVIIDREKVGHFEMPIIRSSHDMALWLSILKKGFYAYGLNEMLAKYRLVANSNTSKKIKAAKDVWKVYINVEKLNFFYSIYNFIFYAINAILKRI